MKNLKSKTFRANYSLFNFCFRVLFLFINCFLFFRSPKTIRKQLKIRSQSVNTRISFDLCPEIESALKEKGIISKFEMNAINSKDFETNTSFKIADNSFEKSKSLYEFEDLELVCNKTLNILSETQLNDVVEPSGFWNSSLLEMDQSPKIQLVNRPSTIFEESGSTTKSFETACVSENSSYFTAKGKSGKFKLKENHKNYESKKYILSSILAIDETEVSLSEGENGDSLIILSDSHDETEDFKSKTGESDNLQLEFNDTLEEIEFIMTKGKDYIKNVVEKVTLSINDETGTELDKENMFKSKLPTPTSAKFQTKSNVPFKKPLSVSSLKKIDFNHIRSPIGEYIKKTAKSPMIVSAKPDTITKQSRQLTYNDSDSTRRNPSTIGIQSLPKKAYISSGNKKV